MRLPSPKLRTVLEVLVTLAVLAYVSYDLVGRGGRASAAGARSHHGSPPAAQVLAAEPSHTTELSSAARVHAQQMPPNGVALTPVCGSTTPATNPVTVAFNQALVFQASCSTNPTLLLPNGTSLSAVVVNAGGYIVLANMLASGIVKTGDIAQLDMKAGSLINAVIPTTFQPNQYAKNARYDLLVLTGSCPTFGAVTPSVGGCPTVDDVTKKVGSYTCNLIVTPSLGSCTISLSITGPFSVQANGYIRVVMRRDCGTTTQAQVKLTIADVVGIPQQSVLFTYWGCGSITGYLTTMGGTAELASSALGQIYTSMLSGALNGILLVSSVSIVSVASPAANYTYATVNYAYYYPYVLPYLVPYSESNPGLLALLTLLLIPVAIGIALLCWCAQDPYDPPVPLPRPPVPIRVPVPVPVHCPPPPPVCCCEPVCCPPPPVCCYDPPCCCEPLCCPPPCYCEPVCCPTPVCPEPQMCCPPPACYGEPVCCPSPPPCPPPCPPPQPCFQTVETVTVTDPEVVSY